MYVKALSEDLLVLVIMLKESYILWAKRDFKLKKEFLSFYYWVKRGKLYVFSMRKENKQNWTNEGIQIPGL